MWNLGKKWNVGKNKTYFIGPYTLFWINKIKQNTPTITNPILCFIVNT